MHNLRKNGTALHTIERKFHISPGRLKNLFAGTVKPDKAITEAGGEESLGPSVEWPPRKVLDLACFKAAGVPDTAMHRNACKGRSRAWMRLYALRCANPGYSEYGDAPDAVSPRRAHG